MPRSTMTRSPSGARPEPRYERPWPRQVPPVAVDFDSLTFSEVPRNFGRRRALSRTTLSCTAGEIVALLGPSGAGKSTLLSIAATLLAPSSGEVRCGTHTARAAGRGLRGRIGLLGHDLYIYQELS